MRLGFLLPEDATAQLVNLAQKKDVSPYTLLVSAIDALSRAQHLIEEGKVKL